MPDENKIRTISKRPRGLRWLCAFLLVLGMVNLGTAVRALQLVPEYARLQVSFPPLLHAVFGFFWGLAFFWAAGRIWLLRNGSPRQVFLVVGAYGLYQVIWWRLFVRSDYALARWPFAVLVTFLTVSLVFWYLRRLEL